MDRDRHEVASHFGTSFDSDLKTVVGPPLPTSDPRGGNGTFGQTHREEGSGIKGNDPGWSKRTFIITLVKFYIQQLKI